MLLISVSWSLISSSIEDDDEFRSSEGSNVGTKDGGGLLENSIETFS